MEDCTLVVVLKAYLQLHKFYIMSLCILNLCCNRMILWVAFGGGKDYIILWVQTLRNGSLKAKRWIMVLLVWMRTVTMFLTSWYPDLYKVPSCTESRLVFLVNVCVCVCVCVCVYTVMCDSLQSQRLWPTRLTFSRQEYWSGLLFPTPGDLPDPGIDWAHVP